MTKTKTKTTTKTTLYDTNGRKISIVKKEITEVETVIHYLDKESTQQVKLQNQETRKIIEESLQQKDSFIKTSGAKRGQKIFCDLADLIVIVQPIHKTVVSIPKEKPIDKVLQAANMEPGIFITITKNRKQ